MSHIAPFFHEVDMFLWFTDNGLSPYWAVGNLCLQHFDGHRKITAEFGGGSWVVRLNYNSETGIAPRESDPIDSPRMYEYKIHADGPGETKADFVLSPRWDDQRKPDGEKMQRPWCGSEGVQIHAQGSNLTYDEYLYVLQRSLQALADDAGTDFSRRYFNRPRGDSNIVTTELYVRLKRDYAKKLVRSTGVFYKIMHLLADQKDTQWVYKGDNTDIVGKRHAVALDPYASSELIGDHSLGKRLKCYHPKYVRSEESDDDPLSSPKFGVAFHKSLNTTEGIAGEYRSGGSAIKWILVSCFGYQGFNNAKFGRIECHEAINAFAREILLDAKETLEVGGLRVLHGIVDSVWVTPIDGEEQTPLDDLAEEISKQVKIRLEYEAAYDWIAFVPMQDSEAGALTKYFGKVADEDEYKYRGIECRQRSTPPLVANVQKELIETLAETRDPEAVCERLRSWIDRVCRGDVDTSELVVQNRVSKSREEYTQYTRNVAALERASGRGLSRSPGQNIEYVVIDDSKQSRDRVALADENVDDYDADFYREQLVRAAESVLSPIGWRKSEIEAYLGELHDGSLQSWTS